MTLKATVVWTLALLAASCGGGTPGGGGGGTSACTTSLECSRGTICSAGACRELSCTAHLDCITAAGDGHFCWSALSVCTAVECSSSFPCPEGLQCEDFLCVETEPECDGNTDCRQPAEKCLDGRCVDRDFCEDDGDCPGGTCIRAERTCMDLPPDTVEDLAGDSDAGLACVPPSPLPGVLDLLCLPCDPSDACACTPASCLELEGADVCLTACDTDWDCPSGFRCKETACRPTGLGCVGCATPEGSCTGSQACDFATGACVPRVPLCQACTLDYQCGPGSRCASKDGVTTVCMPECGHDTFNCPLGSGCNPREDGVYVCVSLGVECCYGPECDTCGCDYPTPVCLEDGSCAQCATHTDCPPDHPVCNPGTLSCELACVAPTPVYWKDPETGSEQCVQCLNSLEHCPPGLYCGVDEESPETYHVCYELP
ncbi:MAG: hypothetical protein FJ098_09985 [Deltaproteobacteria bacterium]|nr:hypothetical protein [Deltaproteobacteria bacterium]